MNKLFLFRTLIIGMLICLLVWDGLLLLTHHATFPPHRDILLTVALFWFMSLFVNQGSDDDWAGQL